MCRQIGDILFAETLDSTSIIFFERPQREVSHAFESRSH